MTSENENGAAVLSGQEDPVSLREILCCILSFLMGYLLIRLLTRNAEIEPTLIYLLPVLTALFGVWVFTAFPASKKRPGPLLWMSGCAAVSLFFVGESGRLPWPTGFVWQDSPLVPLFFTPGFAALLVLSAAGSSVLFRNARLFPLDLYRGLLKLPFTSCILRGKTLLRCGRGLKNRTGRFFRSRLLYALIACLVAAVFLVIAVALLCSADPEFDRITQQLLGRIRFDGCGDFLIRFLFSIPVGALLFGLIEGTRLTKNDLLIEEEQSLAAKAMRLRRVPTALWNILLGLFSTLYLLFFILQATELIPAARANLAPGRLTMAEYALQGFFEMCGIMALNFMLLTVRALSGDRAVRVSPVSRSFFAVILSENVLFALLAAFKLVLYVRSFGFTPLRMQGAFGIVTLLFGCACALIWLFTGKRTAKAFVYFTAGLLALTLVI